jgi:hypothetical protein
MTSPRPQRRAYPVLHWFLITGAAALVVVAIKTVSMFFLSAEARDLQTAMVQSTSVDMERQMQFSIGPGILSLGTLAMHFIADVPPPARQGMLAVRSASVGVYQTDTMTCRTDRSQMLTLADARLAERGWARVVTVMENDDLVLIYSPIVWDESDDVRFCVAVWSERELIIVSMTAETEPLRKLVAAQMATI